MTRAAETPEIVREEVAGGLQIVVQTGAGSHARGILEPLGLEQGEHTLAGRWDTVSPTDYGLEAAGQVSHEAGSARFRLHVARVEEAGLFRLSWRIEFDGGPFTGAVVHPVTLPGVLGASSALDLPSIHYGGNTFGTGLFPHPQPNRGFAFRADRLAQPAIHYGTPEATWSYFAEDEIPSSATPDLLYALGIVPLDHTAGLRLFFRYPQVEFGHRAEGGPDAYIAKSTFGPGENASATWQPGDVLQKTLYIWLRPPGIKHKYSDSARFLWRRAYLDKRSAPPSPPLWWQIGQHVRWYNARLYNPNIGGGQYESPEGSGTAMLGFVEQSLRMSAVAFIYASHGMESADPPLNREELRLLRSRAAEALTRWATDGLSPEGLLYPVCDREGFSFGYRDYSDYENLTITKDDSFDTLRLAGEVRDLFMAARTARLTGDESLRSDMAAWERAGFSVADWFLSHALPSGGYASRYSRTGEPLDPYPAGTSSVVALLCDCAGLLRDADAPAADRYLEAAIAAYEGTLAGLVREGQFGGGTLDASTPDREAAIAALEACISMYEASNDSRYLDDARIAADNLLSYTFVYPIKTFAPDTDAARQNISTFGATIVSPENQHLDPVSSAPGLLLYGLYAGDDICIQAGAESLKWALGGRWVIQEADGLKQSEQLLHTRWYYNEFFSRRGDYRRGMPLWGRTDSEHGWPQVAPSGALLASGQVVVDWPTGRAASADCWQVASSHKDSDRKLSLDLFLCERVGHRELVSVYLRVVRLPRNRKLRVDANGRKVYLTSAHLEAGHLLNVPRFDLVRLTIEEVDK
ncbi:MAG: hypothetical protein QOH93_2201 [Chloroflexia bacterium]|jgi:hypothetical protein|nr:hypothetical protein [Chloroflexia bacterium]